MFERPPSPPLRSTVIEVAHAARPGPNAADNEIVRRLEAVPEAQAARVVTSDRWLADRARALGAAVVPAETFRGWIDP